MPEEYAELIEEWFGKCATHAEVAELYAELTMEINSQMHGCMDQITESQKED